MIEIAFAGGGHAWLVEQDGHHVVLHATVPAPPGAPIAGTSVFGTLQIKVRGCRRIEHDGAGDRFRIEGRFVNLTRAQRERLNEG